MIKIKKYLKDHRIFMMSTIAALTCGGRVANTMIRILLKHLFHLF